MVHNREPTACLQSKGYARLIRVHHWALALVSALLAGLLLTATTSALPAQASDRPDEVHRRNDCRKARQILVHGQPAKEVAWALSVVGMCDDVQETLAEALEEHRADVDQSVALEGIVLVTVETIDRQVFETALSIATDPGAGVVGRIQAIRVLFNQMRPMTVGVTFEDFVDGTPVSFLSSSEPPSEIEPLPADFREQMVAALSGVENDEGAPTDVRNAAREVRLEAEGEISILAACEGLQTSDCFDQFREDEP